MKDPLELVRGSLEAGTELYQVGGALRDRILGRNVHDLDFTGPEDMRGLALRVARSAGANCFALDAERGSWRVAWRDTSLTLDFTPFRGASLEEDLRARDLTINALAERVDEPGKLLDPLNGLQDLRMGVIRACSPSSMRDDPLRILRSVRLSLELHFDIEPETQAWMKAAAASLDRVSAERVRDEWFQLLDKNMGAEGFEAWRVMGALSYFPELEALSKTEGWDAALCSLRNLAAFHRWLLGEEHEANGQWRTIGSLRTDLAARYSQPLLPPCTRWALVGFCGLYRQVERNSESNKALERLTWLAAGSIVANQAGKIMQAAAGIGELGLVSELPSNRAMYRYYARSGEAGVDAAVLMLVTGRAQTASAAARLLNVYYHRHNEVVDPVRLVDGSDLMETLNLCPGPLVGELLEEIRLAQSEGLVQNRSQALELARGILERGEDGKDR